MINQRESAGKSLVLNEDMEKAMRTFWNYLNIREEPVKSDVIFVLGSSTLGPVEKAAELYKAGFAPKIAFISTGGTFSAEETKEWGMPEYEKYREVLASEGVPSEDVVSKGLTSNTLAEAKSAIPFLELRGIRTGRIILVSRPVHQRRAFATFKKQHPEVQYVNCPADEPLNVEDPEMQTRLVQEAERLLDYAAKGDLEKQEIPIEILKAAALIRRGLRKAGRYTKRPKNIR